MRKLLEELFNSLPYLLCSFPSYCNRRRQEKGFHSHLVLPFLCFCHLERNRRRGGREKERGEIQGIQLQWNSKEKNRREMNREEGETKQGAEKMALFFIVPPSLISPFPLSFRNKNN